VLPAIRQRRHSRLYPSGSWYATVEGCKAELCVRVCVNGSGEQRRAEAGSLAALVVAGALRPRRASPARRGALVRSRRHGPPPRDARARQRVRLRHLRQRRRAHHGGPRTRRRYRRVDRHGERGHTHTQSHTRTRTHTHWGLEAEPTAPTPFPYHPPCKNSSDLYEFQERSLAISTFGTPPPATDVAQSYSPGGASVHAHLLTIVVTCFIFRCWLGGRKGIRPVKTECWGASVVVCLQ